jgi:hypothetical protein
MTTFFSGVITTAATQTGSVFKYAKRNLTRSISAQANLTVGGGGTTVKAFVQSSLDGGQNWFDVIVLSFATSSAIHVANASTALAQADTATTDGSASSNLNVIGDLPRAKIFSTGTYTGNTTMIVDVQTDQIVLSGVGQP